MSRYQALLLALAAMGVSTVMPLVPFWPTGIPLVGVLMSLGYMLRYDQAPRRPRRPKREFETAYWNRIAAEQSAREALASARRPTAIRTADDGATEIEMWHGGWARIDPVTGKPFPDATEYH